MNVRRRVPRSNWIGWSAGVVCAVATSLFAAQLAVIRGYGGVPAVAGTAALVLLAFPYFLLGTTDLALRLGAWIATDRARAFALVALPLLPYLIYASGTGSFSWGSTLKLSGYVLLPLGLLVWADRSGPPPRWQDALAVLAIWLPLELGLLRAVWPWPGGMGAYTFSALLGVDVGVILFVAVRRLDGVGYSFIIRPAGLHVAFWNFLIFTCLAIPIGFATRFIAIGHHPHDLVRMAGRFIGIFLGIAVPEELLFRGLIQNLLQRVLPPTYALVSAALIFGASHLNNGPSPDWRYVLLASIAGIFYGRAYRNSGGLMAACLVHASVDTIWAEFFR